MDIEQRHDLQGHAGGGQLPTRREVLRILFRHKRKIIGFFMSVVFVTSLATLLVTPTFQSDAKLLIGVGRESISMDPSVLGPTMNIFQNRANEINSEIDILTSEYLADRVVTNIGVSRILNDSELPSDHSDDSRRRERAVNKLLGQLSVSTSSDNDIITMSLRARNPELAQLSLETLIDLYLDRHIEIHSTQASLAFFEEHSDQLLNKLALAEEHLDRFRNENLISSIDVQKEALIAQVSGLETTINEVNGEVDASTARIAALQNSLSSRPATKELNRTTGITNHAANEIKKRLIDLRFQEADLSARYPDNERALIDTRAQIRVATHELAKEQETLTEITTGIDRNLEALQLDLMTERSRLYASMARLKSLGNELAVRRSALRNLASDETELTRLEREMDIADQEYREYMVHYQRADISAALDSSRVSNVRVVEPASFSSKAVAPRRLLNLLLGLLIGLFGGAALAFLAELLDDSIKSKEDVNNYLGIPVLASFSNEEFQSCT